MHVCGLHLSAALIVAAPLLGFSAHAASVTDTPANAPAWSESGEASWYGPRHEGLRTTSGEVFDSRKMTAAHPTLPLGSYVRVTLQESGRSIIVRVNDREPPHGVRCIDLSHEAAARLGIVDRGVADVTLVQVAPEEAQELAEAPDDARDVEQRSASAPHGRRHTHRAHR
jgi:rare lipoprotein A